VSSLDLAKEWLKKAEHDLGTARLIADNDMLYADQVCYHSQQAAEKSLKAVLAYKGTDIPKTHNVARLIELAAEYVEFNEDFYEFSDVLDSYATDVRYPMGDFEPEASEAADALKMAEAVFSFVKSRMETL
jgi:HEPN domain-containing protein